MTPAEANLYIGRPWVAGARGPAAFDCWGLLKWVERLHFGVALPELPALPDERRDLYGEQMATGVWRLIPAPVHGCGALLRGGEQPHVGVYLAHDGGGVLHAQEGTGVIFTPGRNLKLMGYPRVCWYSFD
ncbi:NlpC/P60 family protein [Paraburkholderia sacchari]|uniref:NlpC/P60 family protein n=1 Tax=Paraburkholderia sacchari TaxID=159450 RepID=UPI001BCCD949|nr:NlpC/P60 family protein [Paraburkholderia sacchari]